MSMMADNEEMTRFVDSHCHIDFSEFNHDRDAIMASCRELGIERILIPGIAPDQWARIQALCDTYEICRFAAGLHPWWVMMYATHFTSLDEACCQFRQLLEARVVNAPRCLAIGECGLDYIKAADAPEQRAAQRAFFEIHLALACDLNLPLILHSVKAHGDMLTLLRRYRPSAGGVVHAFSGSYELAQAYWRLGFRLGVGGMVTRHKATKTRAAYVTLPLEALLLETDAPDMPLEHAQKRNTPQNIPMIAAELAHLRGIGIVELAEATTQNYYALFTCDK